LLAAHNIEQPPCVDAGTYGEYVAVDEDKVCRVPPGVSLQDAAAVPFAGMTAWQALEPAMPLAGKRLLIHGGAGGVGGFAVQVGGLGRLMWHGTERLRS
jgi:NADPH:quinone reductase-like Zn-dependent oxidoreductase